MKPSIAVVGSLNMDFVVTTDHLPAPGETVLGREFQMIPGGKGANQACAAGRLGSPNIATCMIGRVGSDVFADHLKASLAAAGVDVSAVHVSRSAPTGVALIWVDAAGQNSIVVAAGANLALAKKETEAMRPIFRKSAYTLFQLETPVSTVGAALKIAREEGSRTMLDPAPARHLPASILAGVDILTPNESEACILLERPAGRVTVEEAEALAMALLVAGPKAVILKLGELGCYYRDADRRVHSPGFKVEAKDSTAAGDTFNGALAVALAEGRPIEDSLRFANAAAALSVTRMGAQASIPPRADVDEFLRREAAR